MLCFIPNVEPVNASLKKAEEETPKGPRQRKKPKWLQTFETGNQYDSITKLNLETMEDTSVTSTKCYRCEKRFPSKKSMMQHVLDIHTLPSVNCEKCDKKFPTKQSMLQHMSQIHHVHSVTSVKLNCDKCDKSFPSQRLLFQHVASMHNRSATGGGGTVAYCGTCDKKFSSPMDLKQHVDMTHSTRNCTFCGNSFRANRAAKNPYNFCDKCNKKLSPVVFMEDISHLIPKGTTTIYNIGGLEKKKDKMFQRRPAKVSYVYIHKYVFRRLFFVKINLEKKFFHFFLHTLEHFFLF